MTAIGSSHAHTERTRSHSKHGTAGGKLVDAMRPSTCRSCAKTQQRLSASCVGNGCPDCPHMILNSEHAIECTASEASARIWYGQGRRDHPTGSCNRAGRRVFDPLEAGSTTRAHMTEAWAGLSSFPEGDARVRLPASPVNLPPDAHVHSRV